jgi:L,D-peptidoglycan transpeptidase YkuD (ErfK/YbiS/YcfS/YnhG family)
MGIAGTLRSIACGVLGAAVSIGAGGCAARVDRAARSADAAAIVQGHEPTLVDARQCLLVINESPPRQRHATAWLLDRTADASWSVTRGPIPCSVGANGIARPGEKVEGDKMTPSGSFTLTEALGRDHVVNTKLAYRQATDHDAWDERPESPTYNQWVSGEAAKGLTERLGADSELMRVCIVVDYNRWPAVPWKGSAIFIHRAYPDGSGTLGCIGFEKDDLDWLLATLDPAKKPRVVIVRGE